jgi:enoyl-CoA hydratase
VLYRQDDGIGIITFNRPAARNALTFAMYDKLAEICRSVTTDGDVRALVIIGAGGRAFAAGTDISSFRDIRQPKDALAYEQRINEVLGARVLPGADRRRPCRRLHRRRGGDCRGLRPAHRHRDLKFGFPIARTLGNCLSNASLSRLVTLIGAGRTREIIFTARLIGAEEALAVGLVSRRSWRLRGAGIPGAGPGPTLAGHAPLTLRATKEALRRLRLRTAEADDHDLITMCYMSEDFREGQAAFLEKRPPRWKGR